MKVTALSFLDLQPHGCHCHKVICLFFHFLYSFKTALLVRLHYKAVCSYYRACDATQSGIVNLSRPLSV